VTPIKQTWVGKNKTKKRGTKKKVIAAAEILHRHLGSQSAIVKKIVASGNDKNKRST